MSWMYGDCSRQFKLEFSALETSCIAISFFAGLARSDVTTARAADLTTAGPFPHATRTSAAVARSTRNDQRASTTSLGFKRASGRSIDSRTRARRLAEVSVA